MTRLVAIVLWIGFAFRALAQAPAPDGAALASVEGLVEVMKAGGPWVKASPGLTLTAGDRVRTGAKSRAAVRLFDSSVIRIAPLTTFELIPGRERKPVVDLKSGSLYFFSRQKPEDVRFRTPTLSGAIRGTEFVLRVGDGGATELALIEGEVALRQEERELVLHGGELAVAPTLQTLSKQPLLNAKNAIQWVLYYPIVLDPAELTFGDDEKERLGESLQAYRRGNPVAAAQFLDLPSTASDAAKHYADALGLAFGERNEIRHPALLRLLAAVDFEDHPFTNEPGSGSEWLAESFYLQSKGNLAAARTAALKATELSPSFGAAWIRVGELEWAHGQFSRGLEALKQGLELSPENAHGHAVRGFILSQQYRNNEAIQAFDRAIELNGGLGTAWLGRGLAKIKRGEIEAGRHDLQTAVALEPQRAVFRAYLARAFAQEGREPLAEKDFRMAKQLDAADPTGWYYSGLFHHQENQVNAAIDELQRAIELNNNQQIFRSTFLLDQDRATRGANLASVYRDAGMLPVGVSQAARAVSYDYANYSSHLYLAQSYELLRDPNRYYLRYESARLNELYLASLLSPVGGFSLSQNVGNQDGSRLFDRNRLGLSSETEYLSRGARTQIGSQFGTLDRMAYSVDAFYRTDNGQRPNNDFEQRTLSLQAKYQLTYRDSIYFQGLHDELEAGDVTQLYDPATHNPDIRMRVVHEPDLLVGYHREWDPGKHTLVLLGRSDTTATITDPDMSLLFLRREGDEYSRVQLAPWHQLQYEREYELYTAEAQQILQTGRHTYIAGARYQSAEAKVSSRLTDLFDQPRSIQEQENNFYRLSIYGYYQWQVLDSLQLTAGVAYDQIHFPRNIDAAPLSDKESSAAHLSPKAGLQYTPWRNGTFRAAFTRSLGGVSLDNNLRLEPTQIGGFNQTYRSLIPESIAGIAYGEEFQTISAGYDHVFPTRTYLGIEAEHLSSEADRWHGILTSSTFLPIPDTPANTVQELEFTERAIRFYAYQLIGRDLAAGATYKVANAEVQGRWPELSSNLAESSVTMEATLHELLLSLTWNHPSGFFSQIESALYSQSNSSNNPGPGDEFWQHNLFAGYRFRGRAAELRLGILNLANQDYRLNPLNIHRDLPRERTFTARLRLNF